MTYAFGVGFAAFGALHREWLVQIMFLLPDANEPVRQVPEWTCLFTEPAGEKLCSACRRLPLDADEEESEIRQPVSLGGKEQIVPKTVLSFYCDDTNPYVAPPAAFATFLDSVRDEGIAGESTVLLGYEANSRGLLSSRKSEIEQSYVVQLQRAFSCGIDTHMELMTHGELFDFGAKRATADAIHEGVWLFEPGVSVDEYEAYFSHIIDEGERIGIRFTGLTQPGCGCDACVKRYRELATQGITQANPNPNMFRALLNLAQRGRLRGKTVPLFIGSGGDICAARRVAAEGDCAVYDLPPNATDRFGLWLNAIDEVDADYYITEDGRAGRIVESVRAQDPYCIFYCHWQGLNPANGVGWNAFKAVIRRIGKHLGNQVIWQRPSAYTDALQGKTLA